jgi:hypothetical protein
VTAIDQSSAALAIARANATSSDLGRVRFLQGDWFAPLVGERFDLIAFESAVRRGRRSGVARRLVASRTVRRADARRRRTRRTAQHHRQLLPGISRRSAACYSNTGTTKVPRCARCLCSGVSLT